MYSLSIYLALRLAARRPHGDAGSHDGGVGDACGLPGARIVGRADGDATAQFAGQRHQVMGGTLGLLETGRREPVRRSQGDARLGRDDARHVGARLTVAQRVKGEPPEAGRQRRGGRFKTGGVDKGRQKNRQRRRPSARGRLGCYANIAKFISFHVDSREYGSNPLCGSHKKITWDSALWHGPARRGARRLWRVRRRACAMAMSMPCTRRRSMCVGHPSPPPPLSDASPSTRNRFALDMGLDRAGLPADPHPPALRFAAFFLPHCGRGYHPGRLLCDLVAHVAQRAEGKPSP